MTSGEKGPRAKKIGWKRRTCTHARNKTRSPWEHANRGSAFSKPNYLGISPHPCPTVRKLGTKPLLSSSSCFIFSFSFLCFFFVAIIIIIISGEWNYFVCAMYNFSYQVIFLLRPTSSTCRRRLRRRWCFDASTLLSRMCTGGAADDTGSRSFASLWVWTLRRRDRQLRILPPAEVSCLFHYFFIYIKIYIYIFSEHFINWYLINYLVDEFILNYILCWLINTKIIHVIFLINQWFLFLFQMFCFFLAALCQGERYFCVGSLVCSFHFVDSSPCTTPRWEVWPSGTLRGFEYRNMRFFFSLLFRMEKHSISVVNLRRWAAS